VDHNRPGSGGTEPHINLSQLQKPQPTANYLLLYKLMIAAGNRWP
jgi:hypothetical protein